LTTPGPFIGTSATQQRGSDHSQGEAQVLERCPRALWRLPRI